jgi:four helix bundle protein
LILICDHAKSHPLEPQNLKALHKKERDKRICDRIKSVPLNIAEGAGEFSGTEKSRFYRMAKRSATECAGIFDVCIRLQLIEEKQYKSGRELILRIVSMLTKMAKTRSL